MTDVKKEEDDQNQINVEVVGQKMSPQKQEIKTVKEVLEQDNIFEIEM